MTKKVMESVDERTGRMRCKVCGAEHYANLQSGYERADGVTRYYRGSWQCQNGCKIETKESPAAEGAEGNPSASFSKINLEVIKDGC